MSALDLAWLIALAGTVTALVRAYIPLRRCRQFDKLSKKQLEAFQLVCHRHAMGTASYEEANHLYNSFTHIHDQWGAAIEESGRRNKVTVKWLIVLWTVLMANILFGS